MTDPDEEHALLYRAPDAQVASLMQAMLEAAGVKVWLSGGLAGLVGFGELGADAMLVDVHVRRPQLAEAQRLLQEFWARRRDAGAEAPGEGWKCPSCGEPNDASFDLCWNCQEPARAQGGSH